MGDSRFIFKGLTEGNVIGTIAGDVTLLNTAGDRSTEKLLSELDTWLSMHSLGDAGYDKMSSISSALRSGNVAGARSYIRENKASILNSIGSSVAASALWEAIKHFASL